jgi:uncharacterized protein YyaL (SSP411 family)
LADELLQVYDFRSQKLPWTLYNFKESEGEILNDRLDIGDVTGFTELLRLAKLTGENKYSDVAKPIMDFLEAEVAKHGTLTNEVLTKEGRRNKAHLGGSIGGDRSLYTAMRNMLNAYLITGEDRYQAVYNKTKEYLISSLTFATDDGVVFIGEKNEDGQTVNRMSHATCQLPGLLA